jgi:hypothetical protein
MKEVRVTVEDEVFERKKKTDYTWSELLILGIETAESRKLAPSTTTK